MKDDSYDVRYFKVSVVGLNTLTKDEFNVAIDTISDCFDDVFGTDWIATWDSRYTPEV